MAAGRTGGEGNRAPWVRPWAGIQSPDSLSKNAVVTDFHRRVAARRGCRSGPRTDCGPSGAAEVRPAWPHACLGQEVWPAGRWAALTRRLMLQHGKIARNLLEDLSLRIVTRAFLVRVGARLPGIAAPLAGSLSPPAPAAPSGSPPAFPNPRRALPS